MSNQEPTKPKTNKRQAFREAYLKYWNATKAAQEAGYAHPRQAGSRLLSNVDIQAAIKARIAEKAMGADEVLLRLAEQARASMEDFIIVDEVTGQIKVNLQKARNRGKLHLVKKISLTAEEGLRIELYDAQDALKLIGQHHKLFTQRHEIDAPALAPLLDVLKQEVGKFYGGQD